MTQKIQQIKTFHEKMRKETGMIERGDAIQGLPLQMTGGDVQRMTGMTGATEARGMIETGGTEGVRERTEGEGKELQLLQK